MGIRFEWKEGGCGCVWGRVGRRWGGCLARAEGRGNDINDKMRGTFCQGEVWIRV